ncbi:hypothetical protein H0H93_001738 [Arthromyces matolae]|nr:hypothetical protein H0H93_001738 [Arthromyces matolae]
MHLAFISLNGKQHLYIQGLHRRYGDVVRTGPNELSFCRPDFIVPMFGCNGLPKSSFWDGQLAHQEDFRAFLGIRDPKTHARRRQTWARGFTSEAIRSYSPTLIKRVGQLLEHLGTQTGEVIDLSKWINWFSYDVMNDVVFGDDIQVMETQDALGRWNAMVESDR